MDVRVSRRLKPAGVAYSALCLALGLAFDYAVGGVESSVCNETTEAPTLDTRRLIYDRSFFLCEIHEGGLAG
jgi:hypothetical protein